MGPLEPSDAVLAIEEASSREQVFDLLLRAALGRARFAALLTVHPEHIRGRRALAVDGIATGGVETVHIPRNTVPVVEGVIASKTPAVGPIATGEMFVDGFLESLGAPAREALILPILLGGQTVALVLAHRGREALAVADVEDLYPLVPVGSRALMRVLGGVRNLTPTRPPPTVEPPPPPPKLTPREAIAAHRTAGAWEALAGAIREVLASAGEDERLELLVELGRVELEQLGHPERALEALRGAQAIDATDKRVLEALEQLLAREERWAELAELLEQRIALTEPRGRVPLLLRLATVARERLHDDERAIASYQRILGWEPWHEVATRQLENLWALRQDWRSLVGLLLERAQRHSDGVVCIEALEAAAHIYADELGDARAAFLVWLAVIRREPARPHVLEQLYRLAPAANSWDEILGECGVLGEQLEADHPSVAAAVWHLVGRWMRDRVDNRGAAVRAFDKAVRLSDDDPDMLGELLDILRADQRWPELIAVLVRRADAERDAERRAELYVEIGETHEAAGQRADAIHSYKLALEADASATEALVELHRLYLEEDAWEELAELVPRLIAALAETAPPQVIVDLHVELGAILAERRTDHAIRAFRDALELDPGHAPAFEGLERVYLAAGRTEDWLELTEAHLARAGRVTQLARLAEVASGWHRCARPERAIAAWQRLIALEPKHVEAHRGLASVLRELGQWSALVGALRMQLQLLREPADRIALLLELAGLLETRLEDADSTIAVCEAIVRIAPGHTVALDTLARLYDRAGRWQPTLDALQRLLDAAREPRVRAELMSRMGHTQLSAHDTTRAHASFAQAIELDATSATAHEGLARLHLQEGKLVAAGEELVRAAQLATDPADTLRCLADAAWLYRYRLDDGERARQALLWILERDPDHADAKQALAELLQDTRQWETLWPHLAQQVERLTDETAAAERLELLTRAARCAVELGKFAEAQVLYDRACALDATPATLLERAAALHRSNALEAAAASYQTLARREPPLAPPQLLDVYRRLARIHTELDHGPQALAFHTKVLELAGPERDTLAAVAELYLRSGDVDEGIATLRRLVAATGTWPERIALLEQIGDLYRDQLANPARAMSTYLEALELDATNRRILQRLLDQQSAAGQWTAVVGTIDRFLAQESDPAKRASYHVASAEIRRAHLVDRAGALECYERALDDLLAVHTPATRGRALETFRELHELVVAEQDWKYLEQAYRRMIKRLPVEDPALRQLWQALGEIYRTHLNHPKSAIEAFEVAHALDPSRSPDRARVLAELYADASQPQQVTGRAAKLVEADPANPDAYRAIGRASLEAGRLDEAWCVARALVFHKQATADEKALYAKYQGLEVRKATGILDDDSWQHVRHVDEDRAISAILAMTWDAAVAPRAAPAKSFELKAKERMQVEHDSRVVAKIFRHAARVLNVGLPDVYVQPRRSGRLLLANTLDKGRIAPVLIVGRDLMTGYRDTEIAAAVGAMMAQLRPAYFARLALPSTDELEALIVAAAQHVGVPRPLRPELEPLVATFAPELPERVSREAAMSIAELAGRLPEQLDLARWRQAVDAASHRAGLLVSGELAACARMASSDPTGAARPSQRVQELVAYSVSPPYFAVRRHLGVAIE